MTIDLSNRKVIIDDFIGGRKGRKMCLKWIEWAVMQGFWQVLDISIIRKSIAKQLKNRKYDFMIFVETGGVYFLNIPKISNHAKNVMTLPVSERGIKYPQDQAIGKREFILAVKAIVDRWILQNKEILLSSKNIAIVEGDVGIGDFSYIRLAYIKKAIQKVNPNAKMEIIVGIMTTVQESRRLFDIVGVIVLNHKKLSDIAHDWDKGQFQRFTPKDFIEELLTSWHQKK